MHPQQMALIAGSLLGNILLGMPTVGVVSPVWAAESLTHLFPALRGVSLTGTQQSQIQVLSDQMLPQLQQLLTPAQQRQFQAALQTGKGVRVAILSVNLSPTQRFQVWQLLQTVHSQLTSVLTPEQQQQVRTNVQTLQQQGR